MVVLVVRAGAGFALALGFVAFLDVSFFAMVPSANAGAQMMERNNDKLSSRRRYGEL
jgi:hypothetical protein